MFEIGDKVQWTSGKILSRGIVYDDNGGDTVEVVCLEIAGKYAKIKVNVVRELLTKSN